jgi:hypothetical protein
MLKLFRCATLLLPLLLLCSCASSHRVVNCTTDTGLRFHGQADTDVVVHFLSWRSISITKPDTAEDNFLPIYTLIDVERVLSRTGIPHRMAAVVCGYAYEPQQETEQQEIWGALFLKLGFQGVVFLRAGRGENLNGLTIIKELHLSSGSFVLR